MKVPGKPRRIEIDFVRGVAILMVMMLHFRTPDHSGIWVCDAFKTVMLYVGGHGVTLFFVLSGFLVGGLLLKEYRDTSEIHAGRFLIRRMFKIWPAFYFLLLFHVVTRHHPFHSFFWQNFFQVQNYLGSSIAQTWSLGVEEHFYVCMPLLMAFMAWRKFSPKQMLATFGTIGLISLAWHFTLAWQNPVAYNEIQHYTQFNVDSLLCGVCLALFYHMMPNIYAMLSARAWPLILISIFGLVSTRLPRNHLTHPIGQTVAYIASACFLMLVMEHSGSLTKTWPFRMVSTIGIYSYGIYLYHSIMLGTGEKIVAHFAPKPAWFLAMSVQTVGALIAGFVATRVVEWPFLMWRERIKGLRDQKALVAMPNEGEVDPVVELNPSGQATV